MSVVLVVSAVNAEQPGRLFFFKLGGCVADAYSLVLGRNELQVKSGRTAGTSCVFSRGSRMLADLLHVGLAYADV